MEISQELLNKYNVPVPRYTSYPPANHFRDTFGSDDYRRLLIESDKGKPQNLALYFHIPFCKKICYYCGCNACSIGNGESIIPYMAALIKEVQLVKGFIDKGRRVSQVHFGGGTPNSIDVKLLRNLIDYLKSEFTFIDESEIAIECNPAYLDFNYIDELIDAGFNRFSLGIQDFDNKILRLVNRQPSSIPPAELLKYIRNTGKNIKVNFDFIYGLPQQTVDSFSLTIQEAIKIRPDRLVTFSYAHVPWVKKHQLILEKSGLPSSEEKMNMFLLSYELLKEAGYKPIGLDHFVLPEDDLFIALTENKLHRNFQGYCTRRTTGQVYAFGVTAISQLENGYSQNTKILKDYISDINDGRLPVERGYILNEEQKIIREVITELMCNKKINLALSSLSLGISVADLKKTINFDEKQLKVFSDESLLRYSDNEIEVTEKGTLFIRNIAALFDSGYKQQADTYSKPV